MSKVVKLVTSRVESNKQTIDLLRDWLARAERGEVVSVALVGVAQDGRTISAWTAAENSSSLVGGLEILKYRVMTEDLKVSEA